MAGDAPKDVLEKYEVGTAVVTTYQTSGVARHEGSVIPTQGQADSYTVVTSPGTFDEAKMNRVMDSLSDVGNTAAGGNFDKGSTGALVSVSQPSEKAGTFDVVVGTRGDSQIFLARVDAQNNVTLVDFNSRMKPAENPMGSLGFGAEGERGGNELQTERVEVKPGEKVFVIAATDGAIDPHVARASAENMGRGGYVTAMQNDIQAYLKANPDAPDLSRFLAERATKMGSDDNTTIASVRLGAETDLKGRSVTMAVFDGTGHEDGALSSALAKAVDKHIPGGQTPAPVSRSELDHVSTRTADLARVADPGTPDPHVPAAKTAPPPAKKDPPKNGGDGNGGTPVPARKPVPHAPSGGENPPPKAEHPPVEKPAVEPHSSKFTAPNETHSTIRKTQGAAGHAVGAAQVGLDIAEGRYDRALQGAATQVALNPNTYKAAATLAEEGGTVARALGFFGKKVPVLGAVVTAGFVLYEVGGNVYEGKYAKAAAAAGAGTAEALGNIVGFGVGDAAREGVRETIVRTAGEEYAPDKSGIRTLVEEGVEVTSKFINGKREPEPTLNARQTSAPGRPVKPPTMG